MYKSVKAIWEDEINLPKGYDLYLIHSRLASVGGVSLSKTHPIIYGPYAIVHNGTFNKRKLAEVAKNLDVNPTIGGSTDTELFLKIIVKLGGDKESIRKAVLLTRDYIDPEEPLINFAVVNLENLTTYFVTYRAYEDPHLYQFSDETMEK